MNEKYIDEDIIKFKREKLREKHKDIHSGIYVDNELLMFEKVKLFNENMSILLPQNFRPMTKEEASYKYPAERRPEIIQTSDDCDVNFAFSLFDFHSDEKILMQILEEYIAFLRRMNPSYLFNRKLVIKTKSIPIGFFDFRSNGIDDQIYQLFYYFPLKEKTVHGIFNCQYSKRQEWIPICDQV